MTQEVFPEVQAATQALEKQIALTDGDRSDETDDDGQKQLIRGWRKAISAVNPKQPSQNKRAAQ
jgi:hypothetical protein